VQTQIAALGGVDSEYSMNHERVLFISDAAPLSISCPAVQIAALGGMAVIVAQPSHGLEQITALSAKTFAEIIQGYEEQGASMLIEFGHEMNGNWYAWGQQPSEYISKFQIMSTAIA